MSRCAIPVAILAATAALDAQSYADLIDSRNGAQPYRSIFQAELGAIGAAPQGSDPANDARGLDHAISWDARLYYRDEQFSSRRGTLEAYAGRDGMYLGFSDGDLIGDDTVTRFELHARPWMFYRDGFYRGDTLVPNGLFDGSDYEGYLGFGREANDGLYIEFGPFYKRLDFAPSELTVNSPNYTVPDGYAAYGGRLYLEQRNVQLDRRRGVPREGFVVTLIGEREWNDSRDAFGLDAFQVELPNAVWRARARLEWYIPASDNVTWELFARGGLQDERDYLQNIEGQRPLGNQWADVQLRLRAYLGESFVVAPFGHMQYSRLQGQFGEGAAKEFFPGGGIEAWLHFSDAVSLNGWYSFLNNENRPSIRVDRDVHGENMFYLGMIVRIGAARR